MLEALYEIENEIKEVSNHLKQLIRDDGEFRNEVVSQTQYSLKIKKLKLKSKDFVEETDSEHTEVHNQNIDSLRVKTGLKLPKFVLQKFDGDILRRKLFGESFEAAVHKNERISDVEKFTYLLGFLEKAPPQTSLDERYLYSTMGIFERKVWESQTNNFHTYERIDKIKQSKWFKCNRIERII